MRARLIASVAFATGALGVVGAALASPLLDIERFSFPKELCLHLSALVALLAVLRTKRLRSTIRLEAADLLLAGFFAVSVASTAWTFVSPGNGWLAWRALGVTASSLALYIAARTLAGEGDRALLLSIVSVATLIAAGGIALEAYGVIDMSLPGRGPSGTLGVRNYAAHLIAIGTPSVVLLASLARQRPAVLAGCALTIALGANAVALTRSRAAWLALIVALIVGGALVWWRQRAGGARAPLARSLAVSTMAPAILGVAVAVVAPNALQWSSAHPYRESLATLVEHETGTGHTRKEQHARALDTMAMHPVLGVGPGNWTTSYAHVAREGDTTYKPGTIWAVPAYPASDWVAVLSERGPLALVLVLLAGVSLVVGRLRGGSTFDQLPRAMHFVATLVITFVVATLDAVLQMPAPAFVAALALAASWTPGPVALEIPMQRRSWSALASAVVLMLGSSTLLSTLLVVGGWRMGGAASGNDLDRVAGAARLLPGHARSQAYLAHRFMQQGDCARAGEYAQLALERDPTLVLAARVHARCSPDRVLFEAERAAVTSRIARSSQLFSGMAFSASRRSMAYATEHGEPALFVARTSEEPSPRRLAAGDVWTKSMAISADDRWLVAESRSVIPPRGPTPRIESLRIYDLQQGTAAELVRGSRTLEEVAEPAFAPAGSRVAYKRAWQEGEAWRFSLHVMDVASRTDATLLTMPHDEIVRAPSWFPDGSRIAFVCSPDVCVVDSDGRNLRRLTRFPRGSRAGHRDLTPDPPQVSPDGTRIAFSAQVPGECFRLRVIDVRSGEVQLPFPDECAIMPQWEPDGAGLLYVRLLGDTRTLWRRPLGDGGPQRVSHEGGMVYSFGVGASGDVFFHGALPDTPSAIYHAPAAAEPALVASVLEQPLDERWISRPRRSMVPTSAGTAAIEVFDGLCVAGRANTALVWLHPRHDFRPHSWKQEIQFLAASGVTVLSVDYTGAPPHPGGPAGELEEMAVDTRAAIELAHTIPGVDADRVFLLLVSDAAAAGYDALKGSARVAGLIDWVGILTDVPVVDMSERLPPTLFIHGKYDVVSPLRRSVAERLDARGVSVVQVEYIGDHLVLDGAQRARALEAARWFVDRVAGGERCTLP